MDEPVAQPVIALVPYEAPAILWEDELTALAACSPGVCNTTCCPPEQGFICNGSNCEVFDG